MDRLDRIAEATQEFVKASREVNPGLDELLQSKRYRETVVDLDKALRRQMASLLDSGIFNDIRNAIGKAQDVWTESDYLEVYDAVKKNLDSIFDHIDPDVLALFLIWVFNKGGQDFLNKHNIAAEFDLTNQSVVDSVRKDATTVLSGLDETTTKWVADKIAKGRQAGMTYEEVAADIEEQVPQTYEGRSERIVRTETSRMVGVSEQETAVRNGASHKYWVTVGDERVDDICQGNEDAGNIGIDATFPSGDAHEPAHPNCRCVVEYIFTPFMGSVWHGQ